MNELKQSWNEVEETLTSLRELNDDDLITCRQSLIDRLQYVLSVLDKYVTNEDFTN